MTTTLLAHEFRRTGGTLASVLGGAALVVLVGSLLALTDWPLLATLGVVAGFAAVAVLLPILCLALGIEYWRSAYGRSGYLTHSLPVAGSRIYAVRLLHGLIVSVVGTVVAGLLLLPLLAASVAHEAPTGTSALSYVLDTGRQGLSAVNPLVVVAVVVAVVLAAWGGLVCFYFAASIGSGPRLARLGPAGPIVAYLLLYLVLQVLFFLGIVALPYGAYLDGGVLRVVPMDLWSSGGSNSGSDPMPVGFLPVVAVSGLVLIWWTARSWNRGVSLR